jgi:hypothetical protein
MTGIGGSRHQPGFSPGSRGDLGQESHVVHDKCLYLDNNKNNKIEDTLLCSHPFQHHLFPCHQSPSATTPGLPALLCSSTQSSNRNRPSPFSAEFPRPIPFSRPTRVKPSTPCFAPSLPPCAEPFPLPAATAALTRSKTLIHSSSPCIPPTCLLTDNVSHTIIKTSTTPDFHPLHLSPS